MIRYSPIRRRSFVAGLAFLLAAVLSPGLTTPASAAADTFAIDVGHSSVGFAVRHFFSKVPGRFGKYEGKLVLDSQDLSKSSVNVSIDASSINTDSADRDTHLKSPDFFDAAKFPKITFVSTKVTPKGPGKAQVEGTLTMKGVSKPVTLDVDLLGTGPDAWGNVRGGFEGKTRINRQDFGVAWNKALEGGGTLLGDEVEIVINIEGVKEAPKPAEAAPKK